jgi:hypothetical protein
MLKHKDSPYIWGGRPKEWQKVKKYKTFDVVVMGFEPPEKEYKGKGLESWRYWVDENNHPVNAQLSSAELLERGYIPVTKRHYNGWPGSVIYGQCVPDDDGIGLKLKKLGTFSGMNEEMLEQFGKYPDEYVGTVIEVGAMRQNKKGGALVLPRFKRLRLDKKPTDCILGEC